MMNEFLNKFIHQMTPGDVIWETVDITDSTSQQIHTSPSLTWDKGHSIIARRMSEHGSPDRKKGR